MPGSWIFQAVLFLFILTVLATVLGEYMAKVFAGECTLFSFALAPIEKGLYKVFGIDPSEEMDWKAYVAAFLMFSVIGLIALFALQEFQSFLPLNPQKFGALRWDTALNTAISYITNTNWQAYTAENSMSYLTQMLGLNLQNFLSAACGIAAAVALIRSFIRKNSIGIGNFWVDLTRALLYILLPLAIVLAIVLVSQGCIENFHPYVHAHTLEGKEQVIAQGPAASQIAIKHLGTNGGGFFNSNAAHPYENPTPLSDYLEILALIIIAAAFPFTLGAMLNNRKQGWAIYAAMMLLYLLGLTAVLWATAKGNPMFAKLGIQHGYNFEGIETRIGAFGSAFGAHTTTATSTGSTNAAHDSFMPLISLVLIFNMAIGEVVFGGVGSGLIGMMLYAMLTMFLIGLMIGRSPELFGKKLDPYEMVMVVIALIFPGIAQLFLSAIATATHAGASNLLNPGPHGLSEIIYTYASTVGNNGSNFAGLNSNTIFYNLTTGLAMLIGRFFTIVPALAVAGSLVQKKLNPVSARFPTASPLFILVLVSVVFIFGALTFFPVLVLGPILEHLNIFAGHLF